MTRFTVVWRPETLADLADIWLDADDRESVTRAAAEIDLRLRDDPANQGTQAHEGLWNLNETPLRVLFTMIQADRVVEIVMVRRLVG